jgi:hypothetical protein
LLAVGSSLISLIEKFLVNFRIILSDLLEENMKHLTSMLEK